MGASLRTRDRSSRSATGSGFAVTSVLELSSRGWRGITMTPRAVAEIERLRRGPPSEKNEPVTEEVIAA
jgi:hypothetical protein